MTLRAKRFLMGAGLVAAAALLVVALLASAAAPPDGPVDLPWDRAQCAECGMLVGEPRFAVQVHAHDGTVHAFDDPGCFIRWRADHNADVHAIYFHDLHADHWLRDGETSFVRVDRTPMGYGLGAVTRGTEGALEIDAAAELALHPEQRP